jgi:hypothetical protein
VCVLVPVGTVHCHDITDGLIDVHMHGCSLKYVRTCRLACIPTILSPSFVKATTDGVVRDPSAFSITLGVFPSITETHELVVPKSIPITCPLTFVL